MPAHLRTLWLVCSHEGCRRAATVELFSGRNASFGKYCKPHGEARLKALQRAENMERD
jgi:hypothetical protein